MAYLRMKSLRPRTPALVRSAYVNRAPADSDVSHGQFLLRPTTVPVVVIKRKTLIAPRFVAGSAPQ